MHGRCPLDESKICRLCFQDPATITPAKKYTRKELVMMKTSIADFHTSVYIPEIQKLAFHLTHVHIIGTNNRGNMHHEEFKCRSVNQYVLCRLNYSERAVASFSHQIQSEYYDRNRYVSMEEIELEKFSAPIHIET